MGELLKNTKEAWDGFSTYQKIGAVAAMALTFSRPLVTAAVAKRGLDKSHEWTRGDAILLAGGYATDLEGKLARKMHAETKIGAIADPIADKLAMTTQEAILAYRGEESPLNLGLRVARDIGISALRKHVNHKTDGKGSIKAGWSGKANTAIRKGVTVFATSPLGKKYPKTRRTLQAAVTITTLASGAITAAKLVKELRR